MIDQLGGWSSGKIGEGYGEGNSKSDLSRIMVNLVLNKLIQEQSNERA